jgi:signal peptidase I
MTLAAVLVPVLALLAPLAVLRRTHLVITVRGRSMLPTYTGGEHLLIRRAHLSAVRTGDIVVLARPGPLTGVPPAERLLVKRAVAVPGDPVPPDIPVPEPVVPPGRLVALGDNAAHSYDSRATGYFTAESLLGIVRRPVRT